VEPADIEKNYSYQWLSFDVAWQTSVCLEQSRCCISL